MTDLRATEESLRLATMIERADGSRRQNARLGFAQLNYGRLFVRDYWTLFALAREMDCSIADLTPPSDERAQKRMKWDELVRAAEEILSALRALPAPLRLVAEARADGQSWRKIGKVHADRLMFSLKDDYEQALLLLQARVAESLAFVAASENYFVVKSNERA